MSCTVVIADDQPVVVAGVEAVLKKHRYDVVACVNDTDTFVQVMDDVDVEVVVIDPNLPDGKHPDGVALLRRVRTTRPDVGIVVMAHLGDLATLRAGLDLGVAGLFDKRCSLRDMPLAVHAASVGRNYTSPSIRRAFHDVDAGNGLGSGPHRLSPRELEVIRAYAQGLSLMEVSQLMCRSVKTISRQKRAAMAKLGLLNDAQFYQYLANVRSGLVEVHVPASGGQARLEREPAGA